MRPKFILGLGAQKCGTTWLYRYLNSFENVNLGRVKEYHIWDALYTPQCERFRVSRKNIIQWQWGFIPRVSSVGLLRWRMQRTPGFYTQYFRKLIGGPVNITGDVTPSYSGLTADELRKIKSELEDAGFDVLVIFLMRDPFERCWSAVRNTTRKQKREGSDEAELRRSYKQPWMEFRTNYHTTVSRISEVFDDASVFYGIYEELYTRGSIQRLSDFLKIEPDYEFVQRKFNVSPKNDNVSGDLRRSIIEHYGDVYRFCNSRFPQTKTLWHAAPVEVERSSTIHSTGIT